MLARAARTLPVRAERVFLHLPPRAPPSAHTRPHPTAPLPFQLGSTTQSRAASSLASTDFMHNSFIPTMHYQASLPRLPVPALDGTLDRYLYNVEAVITPDELAHTKVRAASAPVLPYLQCDLPGPMIHHCLLLPSAADLNRLRWRTFDEALARSCRSS